MADFKCPFCGSKEIMIETGFLDAFGEKETTFCCVAQRTNADYVTKNFHPDDAPDPEDVSKI